MDITALHSDKIYQKIAAAPQEKREELYRYELMQPFQKKWDCCPVPLKAKQPGGYDVVIASGMLGILAPQKADETKLAAIEGISQEEFWTARRP